MVGVTAKITRADFVLQPDDTVDWAVEVTQYADDPFELGATIAKIAEPRPMPPEQAQAQFGFTLSDIVDNINDSMSASNATLMAANAALGVQVGQLQTALDLANATIEQLQAEQDNAQTDEQPDEPEQS